MIPDRTQLIGTDSPGPTASNQHIWIEKTAGARPAHLAGEFGVGKALWSPQRSKGGADIYRFMRDVRPGDIILHFTDNQAITGVSQVETAAAELQGVTGTQWGGEPAYRVRLSTYHQLNPPLPRDTLFESPFRERLLDLIKSGQKNLFYNMGPALNQGAYLTPCPPALARILNDAYRSIAGRPIVDTTDAEPTFEGAARAAVSFDTLVKTTYWSELSLSAIIDAVRHPVKPSRQIILSGPPGTSKTFVAQQLVKYLTQGDSSKARTVQFHPSYSYEQFVEGLRPTIENGAVKFEPVAGIVLEMAERCRESTSDHFLVIDELNRANLPRVLGELMYLFEYRDSAIDLPYTRGFILPPNLYFIATMNTADKSIRNIDVALRRRFDVFECQPDSGVLARYYEDSANENDLPDLIGGFEKLNQDLQGMLDRHHTVGHAFFMSSHLTASDLNAVWHRKIFPLIDEYFFASPDIAATFKLANYWPSCVM